MPVPVEVDAAVEVTEPVIVPVPVPVEKFVRVPVHEEALDTVE